MALSQDVQNKVSEQYAHQIYRFCLLQLSGDDEGAKDITQETFLLLAQLQGELYEDHIGSWLYKAASLLIKKYLHRKMLNMRRVPYELNEEISDSYENMPDYIVEEQDERRSKLIKAHKVLQKLSPPEKELFNAYFIKNISYSELAALYNTREATIRQRISRLRKNIKYFLDEL